MEFTHTYRLVRRLTCLVAVALLAYSWPATQVAAKIVLGTNAPLGEPLMIDPGQMSEPLLVTVAGLGESRDPADFIAGWQTRLVITGTADSSGEVRISGVAKPENYVFGSVSQFGFNDTVSTSNSQDDTLLAFDLNFPFSGGVDVPMSPGLDLLELTLQASDDAFGTFDVLALGGVGMSEWTDSGLPQLLRRTFANLPDDLESTVVGQIEIGEQVSIALQAGDADQDLDFDQFDIIRISQGGKYLSSQVATWGDGDFNGAPGGTPGSPPPGDGVFDQLDLIAALTAGTYQTGPYASSVPSAALSVQRITEENVVSALKGEILPEGDSLLDPTQNWATSVTALNASGVTVPVPEPTGLGLMVMGLAFFVRPCLRPRRA